MFGSIYKGMSGLMAFSKGLDVISNNVANLNTPGHKGGEIQFQDLFYKYSLSGSSSEGATLGQFGNGVTADNTTIRFLQGDIRETGNNADVAIDGDGFFIVRDEGDVYYTRAGQFEFDQDGFLIAKNSRARVAALDEAGNLVDISINGLRTNPPQATSEVKFQGRLTTGTTQFSVEDIEVYDIQGNKHVLNLTLDNNRDVVSNGWLLEITDAQDNVVASGGEIRFNSDTTPQTGYNSYTFTFTPPQGEAQEITFFFGEPDSLSGVTQPIGGDNTTVNVASQDGYGIGALIEFEFDREGYLTTRYSNGQSDTGPRLALARFEDPQSLIQLGQGAFLPGEGQSPVIGVATEGALGSISAKSIELSNVDLTQQFSEMIIVQRGYQASSQVLTVANEMLQQLLESVKSR